MTRALLLVAVLGACSNDDDVAAKQKECDAIAANIRDQAVNQYHVPAQGACNNPSIAEPFSKACAALVECNKELADLEN